jgi:hypothetical protein
VAKRQTTRRRHVDRHGIQPPEPVYTAFCETFRHDRCGGLIFSLTVQNGARCECPCHQRPERRAA